MIGVTADEISNSAPTRITLAFLGMGQLGLLLLIEARLARWLQRPWLWWLTVLVNGRIMTWYLWHVTAMVVVVALSSMLLGGFGLHSTPLSGRWWATRPLWCLVLSLATVALVIVFGRFEQVGADPRPAPAAWRPLLATVCVCVGLGVLAKFGIVDEGGLTWLWPSLPVAGLFVFGIATLQPWQNRIRPRSRP